MRNGRVVGLVGVTTAVVVALAACGSSKRSSNPQSSTTPNGGASTSTASAGSAAKFGTLDSPCGKGSAKGATDRGITDTSIEIGYGDDRGFAAVARA